MQNFVLNPNLKKFFNLEQVWQVQTWFYHLVCQISWFANLANQLICLILMTEQNKKILVVQRKILYHICQIHKDPANSLDFDKLVETL